MRERRETLRAAAARAYEERELDATAKRHAKLLADLDQAVADTVSNEAR